ncbi:MAG: hypothetical protein C4524_07460 [Candidatus Zixiibacteriota bacterium]|nr:MAG: hypothetical protein C4524_07460 [candidate division Zixibacteria bacterium]
MKMACALAGLLLLAGMASAAVIHVPAQYPTIQQGINAAASFDTVLVADGIYTGAGNKNLDFYGRSLVLMSEGGADNCLIECQGSGRGLYLHSGETSSAVVKGFTIAHGNMALGGGIHLANSSPRLENCIIHHCQTSSNGGGVYISGGSPAFIHCTIAANSAQNGGGVYTTLANSSFNSCIVAENQAAG